MSESSKNLFVSKGPPDEGMAMPRSKQAGAHRELYISKLHQGHI